MPTFLDSRQIKKRIALLKLGAAAGSTVESILDKINVEFDAPLRMAASAIPDAVLNFSSSLLTAADGANKVVSPVKKQIFSGLTNPNINFQTQAVSNAADFDVTWGTATLGQFRYAAFTLIGSGKIKVLFSGEYGSEAALAAAVNPGSLFVSGGSPIGYITLQSTQASPAAYKTAGSATNIIENAKIYRPAASGSGSASSSSGSGGGELVDLLYQAAIRDSFTDIPDGTTTVDISAGFTDAALHDVANELFRLAYDASKTVSATGTAVTMSSAPAFTVKAGDIINIPGVDSPKKITAVTNQTTYTVESAWTVDPVAAACVVSQAVHTVDLNAFTNGGLGLAASSQFTTNIDDVLVAYGDSDVSGDIIPDFGTVADMGFSVSADGTSWSVAKIRPNSLSQLLTAASTPTSSTQFKIRFFANKTTGSGFVNLLAYKAFFHKQTGETVGAQLLSAFARPTASITQNCTVGVSGGKTRFQFTWAYPRGANDGQASGSMLQVYANGQRIPRFVSGVTDPTQAYFTEISDTIIEMDTDYTNAGIDFQFRVESTIIDSNTNNTSRLSTAEDILTQSVDAQVIPTFMTAVNGAPGSAQFRSDITNRAKMVDFTGDLAVQMGQNRIPVQMIERLVDEFGPAGQPVYKSLNDKFNQIRFVGQWFAVPGGSGTFAVTQTINDYVEIVFYGTALNLVMYESSTARDFRASVDGGAETGNLKISASYSNVLISRLYNTNIIVPIVSGLTLGVHTVKIRNNDASNGPAISGFEVITDTSSLRVKGGSAIQGKIKNNLSALATVSHNTTFDSGAPGTRGANVVVYLKADGTIGKAVNPANASQANLASADHTNEEIIRNYNFREFSANRSDDFSFSAGGSPKAFTLDDNTTTLTSNSASFEISNGQEGLFTGTTGIITIIFVGTGLDLSLFSSGSRTSTITVDGTSIGAVNLGAATPLYNQKIVSGLPYGTHVVRITAGGSACPSIAGIIVYGPKKPTVPATAIELGQYYLNADFVANATASVVNLATGVIRKQNGREISYVEGTGGTNNWTTGLDTANENSGFSITTDRTGAFAEYVFWGTGVEFRYFSATNRSANITIAIDGLTANTTNYPGATFSQYGTGSFTAATGILSQNGANTPGSGLRISGLALGLHRIRVTNNTASSFVSVSSFDVICPIHSSVSNFLLDVQSTLSIGNVSISDSRKFNKKDVPEQLIAKVSIAKGVTSSPSTTSTSPVPCPEMSVAWYSDGEWVEIDFLLDFSMSTNGARTHSVIFVDGIQVGIPAAQTFQGNIISMYTQAKVFLTKGFHKIDGYWYVGSTTATGDGTNRQLTVKKLVNN